MLAIAKRGREGIKEGRGKSGDGKVQVSMNLRDEYLWGIRKNNKWLKSCLCFSVKETDLCTRTGRLNIEKEQTYPGLREREDSSDEVKCSIPGLRIILIGRPSVVFE